MKFDVTQRFDADVAALIDCYSSADTYEQLPEFGKITRLAVLDRTERGDRVTLRLHYRFSADLPSAARKIIDPAKLTWVEETVFDRSAMTATTRLLPDHYASKLEASARSTFRADQGSGSIRQVSGDLRVRVMLVAGKVERAIVSGLQEHLAQEATLVAEILDTA